MANIIQWIMSRNPKRGPAAVREQLGVERMAVTSVDDKKTTREAFVKGRRVPVFDEAANRAAAERARVTRLRHEELALFEKRKRQLITTSDPLDDGVDVVLDGLELACRMDEIRGSGSSRGRRPSVVTIKGEFRFIVGARYFGKENQEFHFPTGFDLVRQAYDCVTVASPGVRVTFRRIASVNGRPATWQLDGVLRPEAAPNGAKKVRGTRNRAATYTIRH